MLKNYTGSCHCGAVRFDCELDLADGTTRCNCTFCRKTRNWFAFAKGEGALRLRQGAEVLVDYRHTPPLLKEPFLHLYFCGKCGIRPFGEGGPLPELGGQFYAVNLGALDDATDEELASTPINYPDGRNDAWHVEAPMRYL